MEATRNIIRLLTLLVVLGLMVIGGVWYYQYTSTQRQVRKLEEEKRLLQVIIERITSERRLAEVIVTDQKKVGGVLHTTLLFVEYARDQKTAMVPREFTVTGEMTHVDAMVIKFDRDFVFKGDPLRGCSVALFTKIFGDHQSPEQGSSIDAPGSIPPIYQGADPAAAAFEGKLWKSFWRLAEDEAYRKQNGVRVAHGDGKWWPAKPDFLYTLTIEADGGISLKTEPIKGIYVEALKRRASTQTAKP
jgi:hypothetical protein